MNKSVSNDSLLWEQVRNGNEKAFETLYYRYHHFLLQTTEGVVKDPDAAAELVQQLFVKLWTNRSAIRISNNLKGYLCRMRQNLLYDIHKRSGSTQRYYNEQLEQPALSYTHVEERLNARMHLEEVKKQLLKLSPRKRIVYQLVKMEGLSCEAVAAQFSINKRTVRNQASEAAMEISSFIRQTERRVQPHTSNFNI
ncbi:RNA polymerase sigma-70 factor, ECF subfamily [Filimonas lacunae]|uniref:RNA polymerase sigma-70 factor, ECF subfamily n=1 Tax=Filimonas lacunae TaxID=477680 RepID=A0A173MBV5_9BACT|nr:sigma-70 family RNA polymerase sigma factor [Filimonas lacunae]BAV05025.1 RNA polymerase ECF-type sigma factor [Filimonas lacunae]SIT33632.1 RNA polymerase sigma-70 factor, ECF subfamily [Filimonas lacunae]